MKIKMIGTGSIYAKQRSSCILIDKKILIDCGNGTIKTLLEQNVDINKIDTLLITHIHGDHVLDILFLIMQRKYNKSENELKIYCPIGTENAIKKIIELTFSDFNDQEGLLTRTNVKFIEFERLNNKEITQGYYADTYKIDHIEPIKSFGFVIKNNNKSIGISGDATYSENLDKVIENSDISVLDMTFIETTSKHMGYNDIKRLAEKYNKKIIATHMSEKARNYALQEEHSNIIIPNDGDEIEF